MAVKTDMVDIFLNTGNEFIPETGDTSPFGVSLQDGKFGCFSKTGRCRHVLRAGAPSPFLGAAIQERHYYSAFFNVQ